jgi:periplasmic divalent cation tolerance protein
LVNEKLAACINIIPEVQSVFRWKNKVDNTPENILIIKTTLNLYDILEKRIKQLHPYELPEIIAVPIEKGLTEYLNWVSENTK